MKKTCLAPVMLAAILALPVCALAAKAEPAPCDKQFFYVSANAEIYVKPDRVHLTLGVSERSKDLRAAKERMGETLKKAIAFCKAKGIQDKHIQTSYISIEPSYRHDGDETRLRHYELTQTFTVMLENPDAYETMLYTLLDMGINMVHDVSFTTSALRKHRDEARLAAIRAAQEKAKLLTEAAGLTLGKTVNIINLHEGSSIRASASARRYGQSQNVSERSTPEDAGEGFALGTIPVRAEVTLVYELE